MLKSVFVTLLLLSLGTLVRSDLPVHCQESQVVGTWAIELTRPYVPEEGEFVTCGHKQPDDAKTSNTDGLAEFVAKTNFTIVLYANATAVKIDGDEETTGNWTMLYDEGLDVVFPTERFTNFFYYFETSFNQHTSNCGRTTVGWYANTNGKRACWKGAKQLSEDESGDSLLSDQTEQEYVVQPEEYQSKRHKKHHGSMLEVQSSATKSKKRTLRLESSTEETSQRMENNKKARKYHKDFKNHKELVDKINNGGKRTWKAKAYSEFESKSIGDLNKMAGRMKAEARDTPFPHSFIQKKSRTSDDVSDLPKSWSWKEKLGNGKEQGSCGSCYLAATMQMLESRLKILYDEDVSLSIQYPLDCDSYNQGCDGGYPYLVGLFASQYGLVTEDCAPYRGKQGVCGNMCDISKLDKMYSVSDFRFVGGYYGGCSERAMMLEVMNNGPMIANFEPTNEFMYYEGGVFQSEPASWIVNDEEKPEWQKVSHSVLLYGWGETEDGLKYWICRNSWGPFWGEDGDFRIVRGVDDSAIESYSEAADPVIVYL